jgi:hypothetical protein
MFIRTPRLRHQTFDEQLVQITRQISGRAKRAFYAPVRARPRARELEDRPQPELALIVEARELDDRRDLA